MLQNRDDARDDFLIGAAFRPQNLQPPRESKYTAAAAATTTNLHIPLGRFPTAKLAAHGRDGRSLKALGRRPVGTHAARSPLVPVPALGRDWAGAAAVDCETRPQAETASAFSTTGIWTAGGLARGCGGPVTSVCWC